MKFVLEKLKEKYHMVCLGVHGRKICMKLITVSEQFLIVSTNITGCISCISPIVSNDTIIFNVPFKNLKSRDVSFGIATGYGLGGRGTIPSRDKVFLFSTASRADLGPTQPPIQWTPGALSTGVKWPGREADHSPPSIVEVKDVSATPPLPDMCL
jgi:hypothetical protein